MVAGTTGQKLVLLKCVGRGKTVDTDPEEARSDSSAVTKHLG